MRIISDVLSRLPLLLILAGVLLSAGCSWICPGPSGTVDGGDISKAALSMIGKPYVYGGATPRTGFDCSGLVCWAYGQRGLAMPRTAREQSSVGSSVSKSKLKPGDVVVFRIGKSYHTGIYTGSSKFVHSPGKNKKVRIDTLNSQYWSKRLVYGRRHALLI